MNKIRSAIGLPPIRAEGKAAHPDIYHNVHKLTDEQYLNQLQAYKDWVGDRVYDTQCSRLELLGKLK